MSTPRDLVLWLLEQGYETEYFKLSVADQAEWRETAVLEADRLKTMVDINLYQEYLSRLDGLGVKIKPDLLDQKISRNKKSEVQSTENSEVQKMPADALQNDATFELKRAIDFRNKGEYEESLKVLDLVIKSGCKSDLVDDNYARALVKLCRIPEALAIWQKLVNSDIQRVKENSIKFLEKFLQEFQEELNKICGQDSWKVIYLNNQCNTFEELEMFVLKESIELRNAGHPEVSLLLIQRARQLGFQSSMLSDNQARALVSLKRLREAIDVWGELIDSPNENVSNNAKKMMAKFDAIAAGSIKKRVDHVASELNVELNNLNALESISLPALELCLLKDVVSVRNAGNNEASLRIIDCAIAAGAKRDERLLDNRARALNSLNRFPEAISVWNELQKSDDEDVRDRSKQFADDATTKFLYSIQQILVPLCENHGWKIENLSSDCVSFKDLKQLVLQEAIAARQAGKAEFSYQLIEKCFELGLGSPRLKDNQARALINLKRVPEAVSIWRELLNSKTKSGFNQQIHKMLNEYGLIAERTVVREKCSEYVANGDMNAAREIVINAIINDPDWEESMDLLKDIIKIEANENTDQFMQDRDLKDHRLDLQSYELLLNYLEKRVEESVLA